MSRWPVVVAGHGMVGHRLLEALVANGTADAGVLVLGEEPLPAYDRVGLSSYFDGGGVDRLTLADDAFAAHPGVTLRLGESVTAIDRAARTVTTSAGHTVGYDRLVLATGSSAWVPPIAGRELAGVFVYRTVADLLALEAYALAQTSDAAAPAPAVVLGGGLLGLEAANALRLLGCSTTIVERGGHLMPLQVDAGGGETLRRRVAELGITVLTGAEAVELRAGDDGAVTSLALADGTVIDTCLVVVAAGVRARDELAATAGLEVGARGGFVVDDACQTADPSIWAVGECACLDGSVFGLVAPGYDMAEVVADRLAGGDARFTGADSSTQLKLLGVELASVGDAHARGADALELVYADPLAKTYKKLVVSDDGKRVLGAVLVGDASAYAELRALVTAGGELTGRPEDLVLPERGDAPPRGAGGLPDAAVVCSCNAVTAGTIRDAVRAGETTLPAVKTCTRAGTTCGSCLVLTRRVMEAELEATGATVDDRLCEHFAMPRQELYSQVRLARLTTFTEIVERFGTGRGCDVCKPTVASLLATLAPAHVLAGENAALQDTNDHFLANMQRDGTYSVVPRLAGGEVTPRQLMAIACVAEDYGLYTKITGGQRIDLFGARVEQLPAIWKRLVDAGLESGHAYGKSLRTVKSCVGVSWCRYGVQDSTAMAIRLELRYRGLRAPHKIKSGVSGCARECAEAQSKDFGVIATEKGWNLYLGGNGGFRPRHAELFATDLDDETLVRHIDRFLMFYIRTADRLQRTAPWLESLEGGLDYLREVIVDDSLGICTELDADMAAHVSSYSDEWADVLADPVALSRFASFINAPDTADPNIVRLPEREMSRPARDDERARDEVLVAGPTIPVGHP